MGIKYNNLKAYRKETGMAQEQAAEALGVSRQALAKWERGDTLPDLENVIKLADIYGVTVDYLVRNITGISDEKHDKKHMFGFSNIDEDGRIMLPPECRKYSVLNQATPYLYWATRKEVSRLSSWAKPINLTDIQTSEP